MNTPKAFPGYFSTLIAAGVAYFVVLIPVVIYLEWTDLDTGLRPQLSGVLLLAFIIAIASGILVVPITTGIWYMARQATGEGPLSCLLFGALVGLPFGMILQQNILGISAGSATGLVYWCIIRWQTLRQDRTSPQTIEDVFR